MKMIRIEIIPNKKWVSHILILKMKQIEYLKMMMSMFFINILHLYYRQITNKVYLREKKLQLMRCPVPGCLTVSNSAGRLREHFMYLHFWSQVEVVQEGEEPLPCCNLCGMHMPAGRLIKYPRTESVQ